MARDFCNIFSKLGITVDSSNAVHSNCIWFFS